MNFNGWLKSASGLSDSSIYKYSHAVTTVSNDMIKLGIICKPLEEMELYEIDIAISLIFNNESFIKKNTIGNSMYSNSLKWFRNYINSLNLNNCVVQEEEQKIIANNLIDKTERLAIVKSRIGQGLFRDKLFKKYGKCVITGIDVPQLLIASHIKPWAVSKNEERLSESNGFLLSPTYDRLFDGGLITFDEKGKIKISHFISEMNKQKLHINSNDIYDIKYCKDMQNFLQYHNDVVFIK